MTNPKPLLLLFLLLLLLPSDSFQNRNTEQQQQSHPYWLKLKALFNHAQSYIFPPNLDFRGGISNQEPVLEAEGDETTGSKVKEAVAKSLGEGTATVKDSAKSAAEKLKKTLSSHHQPQEL